MPFAWAEAYPRLTLDDALAKLRAMVSAAARGMRERFGLPLALIVIDTLLPAAGFKDANDTSENQRVMDPLTEVATEVDALVLAVDHFGKDVATGTRNSSVKEAAVDAVLALLADLDLAGNVRNPRLAIRKVRGAPTGQVIPFQTRTVVLQPKGFGLRHLAFLPVSRLQRRQVSLDAGRDLIDALLQLGAGEVLVPSIHRF